MKNGFVSGQSASQMVALLSIGIAAASHAQLIDFETLPDGSPTADLQQISNEYAALGVTFALVDGAGNPIGFPRIAKVGGAQTAFEGCSGADTPRPGQGVGQSFLTDGTVVGFEATVQINYLAPVSQASGVILDIDCRTSGGAPCEQWTIRAFDSAGAVLDEVVLSAPTGAVNPECISPEGGPGDAVAFGWAFDLPGQEISAIRFLYTGAATSVGLAFDNFTPSTPPPPVVADAAASAAAVCDGQLVTLSASAAGGVPPYSFAWSRRLPGEDWLPAAEGAVIADAPTSAAEYRVTVSDAVGGLAVSDPVAVSTFSPVIEVSQESAAGANDFAQNILGVLHPYTTDQTVAAYYGWNSSAAVFAGPEPVLSPDRAHLFAIQGRDGLGLGVVLGATSGSAGGRAEMEWLLTDATAAFLVRDDTADTHQVLSGGATLRASQTWGANFTDGHVIGPLPCDRAWSSDVAFVDRFTGSPTFSGLGTWVAYSGDGSQVTLALSEGRRVRLNVRPGGCSCEVDGAPGVNVFDLLAYLDLWFAADPGAERTGDEPAMVDVFDLLAFLDCWFPASAGGACP